MEAATTIDAGGERGWAAVAMFYVARDLAHAVFGCDPELRDEMRHPISHTDPDLTKPGTNTVIKRHYRVVEEEYLALFGVSLGVRYEGQHVNEALLNDCRRDLEGIMRWAAFQLRHASRDVPDWLTT